MSTWGNRGAVAKSRCARSLTDTHAGLGLSLLGAALQRSSETGTAATCILSRLFMHTHAALPCSAFITAAMCYSQVLPSRIVALTFHAHIM